MIKLLKFFFVLLVLAAVWAMFEGITTDRVYSLNYPVAGWIFFVLYHITGLCFAVVAANSKLED